MSSERQAPGFYCILSSNCYFVQNLFKPIVDRLGYVYLPSERADISQLRTIAIEQAAAAGEQVYVMFDMCRERTMG